MPSPSRVFRVFVSSTFSDFERERAALDAEVFRPLQQLCIEHGYRFQAVDLRWGISEAAAQDQQTMQICLDEVRRCQQLSPRPNFLMLLGDRYGWQPVPAEIDDPRFQQLLAAATAADRELLTAWYLQDRNSLSHRWFLVDRQGIFRESYEWGRVERELRRILSNSAHGSPLPSATEQEIVHGLFRVPDAEEHVFALCRTIVGPRPELHPRLAKYLDVDDRGAFDAATWRRADALRDRVRRRLKGHAFDFQAEWTEDAITDTHLTDFCRTAYRCLERVITAEIQKLESIAALDAEAAAHRSFGEDRGGGAYVGRHSVLAQLRSYVAGSDPNVLIVEGAGGSGKSALLANAAAAASSDLTAAVVVTRFIGATPTSLELRSLLDGICREIAARYGEQCESGTTLRDAVAEFQRLSGRATADRSLVIFLDAIDQLTPGPGVSNLRWLPRVLPAHARMVISILSDASDSSMLAAARQRYASQSFLTLQPLSGREGARLLRTWLRRAGRRLQRRQRRYILQKFLAHGLPLYLKLAFEQACHWRSWEDDLVGTAEHLVLSDDAEGVVHDFLQQLEREERHGNVMVSRTMSALAAARNGLTEGELHQILSADEVVMADFRRRSPNSPEIGQLPIIVWSRLYADLEPYLMVRPADGVQVISFYHRQIERAVRARYLTEPERESCHQRLADFFAPQPYRYFTDAGQEAIHHRKLSELPHQCQQAGQLRELLGELCGFGYLSAMVDAERLLELRDELLRYADGFAGHGPSAGDILRLISEALQHDLQFLTARPDALRQCLWNRCGWHDGPRIAAHYEFPPPGHRGFADGGSLSQLADWWLTHPEPPGKISHWCRSLRPQPVRLGGGQGLILRGHSAGVRCLAFSRDGRQIITGASDGSVRLWDTRTGEQLLRLDAEAETNSVAISPDGEWIGAGLADGMTQIWNSLTGRETGRWQAHAGAVAFLDFLVNDHVITAGTDCQLRIWQMSDGVCRASRSLPGRPPLRCAVAPRGTRMAWITEDRRITVIDLSNGSELLSASVEKTPRDVAFSPDGEAVSVVCHDTAVRRWNLRSRTVSEYPGDRDDMPCVVYREFAGETSDGRRVEEHRILAGLADGRIRVWNARTGQLVTGLTVHEDAIHCLSFSPDGGLLAAGSADATVSLLALDADSTSNAAFLKGHGGLISSLAFSAAGELLATGGQDGSLCLWEMPADGDEFRWQSNWTTFDAQTGRGLLLPNFTSGTPGWRIWDAVASKDLRPAPRPQFAVTSIAFSNDNRRLACGGFGRCEVWDIARKRRLFSLNPSGGAVCSLAFLPDQNYLACGMEDGSVQIWNPAANLCAAKLTGPQQAAHTLAASPDGTGLFAAYGDGSIAVWRSDRSGWKLQQQAAGALDADQLELAAHQFARTGELPKSRLTFFNWRVVAADPGFAVVDAETGRAVAHIPAPGRTVHRAAARAWIAHPSGRIWAAGFGDTLTVYRLECQFRATSVRGSVTNIHTS